MTDIVSKDEYVVTCIDGHVIVKFPKDKFNYIRLSLFEAFKGIFKGNWQIFDEHYAAVDEFYQVMELADKLIEKNAKPYAELEKEYLEKYGGESE